MTAFHDCAHAWQTIGTTSYTGLNWRQTKDVLYCGLCGRYGVRATEPAGTYSPLPEGTLLALQAQERAARWGLLAEHRATVAAESEAV